MSKTLYANKNVFITGGSEGIGFSMAKQFVLSGAHVTILSRSSQKLDKASQELKKLTTANQKVETISLDITQDQEVTKVLSQYLTNHEAPDYLIHCAGFARPGYIEQLGVEYYRKMMDLNYFGIVNVTKAFIEKMMARRSGHIVCTSSMAGYIGLFGYTGYCASKYAVVGFASALKNELKPYKISVSVLCPPNTRTPGLEEENRFKPVEVLKTEEKATVLEPDDVAAQTLKALPSKKFMILPTLDGSLAWYIGRLSPSLLDQFVKRPTLQ